MQKKRLWKQLPQQGAPAARPYTRPGFTAIELIIVLSIFVITVAASLPFAGSFQSASILQSAEDDVVQTLRRAQHRAVTGEQDSAWGVRFIGARFTLYAGDSYEDRNFNLDEVHTPKGSPTFYGASEITFAKLKGTAYPSGSIIISHSVGGITTVVVNAAGRITAQ